MSARPTLNPGEVLWVNLSPTEGREQRGQRPAVIVSTADYLRAVRDLVIVVPVTTKDRGWPHHVQLRGNELGLTEISFAMTEQPRTVSTERIARTAGVVNAATLAAIRRWISDFTVMES